MADVSLEFVRLLVADVRTLHLPIRTDTWSS
jgi:hypothetical protein